MSKPLQDIESQIAAFFKAGGEVKHCLPGDNAARTDKRTIEQRRAHDDAYTDWSMRQGEQGNYG